ncbi:hypothetical protein MAM1_0162c06956 [Mucor ambiguus]|uniref:Uncharacterized protein n=1 Tax=Mucor ambiguus TaxID=91626 RepID=A0A0C9MJ62_9FUNG|nr:hypothetical protein MAM1_0162c06956 [Mucor ambiguus]
MKQFELFENDYWKSTLQSVDATLSMLSAFDERHIEEIDKAIDSLHKLLAMGDEFDKTKRHHQQQERGNNNSTEISHDILNEIAASEDPYQRRLQKAIELSIKDYSTNQRNAQRKTSEADKPQNRQSPRYYGLNTEYDYDGQFTQDMKTAIELSLKEEIKMNKVYETKTHGCATTPAQKAKASVPCEQRNNGKLTSNATRKREISVEISTLKASNSSCCDYDPPTENNEPPSNNGHLKLELNTANGNKVDKKTTQLKPESPLANLVSPTVSAPVPLRRNVPAVLQAQEKTMINVPQPQSNPTQTSIRQSQPSYESFRQYQQQALQHQNLLRQYQQEHLPQPVKFTPYCSDDYLLAETASSTASSGRSSPVIFTRAATGFESKPRKMKHSNNLLHGGVLKSKQEVIGEWVNGSGGADSWEFFASSTDTKWKMGIDTEKIAEWGKEQAKNEVAETPNLPG